MCYEKCFFNKIGRDLILIYRVVHGKVMQTLEQRIKSLREITVCKLGLQMRDEWWLELFEPNDKMDESNSNLEDYVDITAGGDTNSFKYSDTDSVGSDSDTDGDSYHHGSRNNDRDDMNHYDDNDDDISHEGDFGDDESESDISEEDFCSDEESGKTRIPNFTSRHRQDSGHWQIKRDLLKSKDKVMSRSLPSVNDTQTIIKVSTNLMEERFIKTAAESATYMDKEMISRYLAPEDVNDEISAQRQIDERAERRSKSVCTIASRLDDDGSDHRKSPKRNHNKGTTDTSSLSGSLNGGGSASDFANRRQSLRHAGDTFHKHFGQALKQIKNIFTQSSPLKKMQCLTNALRTVSSKIEELRLRAYLVEHEAKQVDGSSTLPTVQKQVDRSKLAVTAEDLLPLLVLLLLKMEPHDVAKLYAELMFISDLMADFLSSGCHSYALCEFQIAFRVLDQTCDELEI